MASYARSLEDANLPASQRARSPFTNHCWVFAAAYAIATTAAQIPFTVFRETDDELERRRSVAMKHNGAKNWRPGRGIHRRALEKHLRVATDRRIRMKGLEADFDHPLMSVIARPNPYMSTADLFLQTHLWMAVRGEVFWLKTDDEGFPVGNAAGPPAQLWPLSPDFFQPIFERQTRGRLIGWKLRAPNYLEAAPSSWVRVELDEVVHFRYPNPMDPLRGMSRITAAAMSIETDLLGRSFNRNLLRQGGMRQGYFTHPETKDEDELDEFEEEYQEKYAGEMRAGLSPFLTGGWSFVPLSLSMVDLQVLESEKLKRQEILAVMGAPDSVLGMSDAQTYATQLGQDRNFLEKTIMPMLRLEEAATDAGLFYLEPDNVLGAFDLRDNEALRAGVEQKITMAQMLASEKLHAPPRVAYEVVGLEVPEYDLDDEVLVGFGQVPLSVAMDASTGEPPPATDEDPDDDEDTDDETGDEDDPNTDDDESGAEEDPDDTEAESRARVLTASTLDEALAAAGYPQELVAEVQTGHRFGKHAWKLTPSVRRSISRGFRRKGAKERRWRDFAVLETRAEKPMRRAYRSWVDAERAATLARFDAAASGKGLRYFEGVRTKEDLDLAAILPDLNGMANSLRQLTRPIYAGTLESIYTFTLDDVGGIAIFELDDPRFQQFFEVRQDLFTEKKSKTVATKLRASLEKGIGNGETIQQLRLRVAEVYDVQAGDAVTSAVARTETAGFMNGARNIMFTEGGFPGKDWGTAGDEVVRAAHVIYGQAGPKRRDFDYLTISPSPSPGRLLHPNDPQGPAKEVIHCRCLEFPATEDEL